MDDKFDDFLTKAENVGLQEIIAIDSSVFEIADMFVNKRTTRYKA